LGQYPAQRRLGHRIIRSKPYRLVKFGARTRDIAALERLLSILQRQLLRGFLTSSRRLCQRASVDREDYHGKKTDEPGRVLEHDQWKMMFESSPHYIQPLSATPEHARYSGIAPPLPDHEEEEEEEVEAANQYSFSKFLLTYISAIDISLVDIVLGAGKWR
jgi:hypothetical protein